MPKAQWGEGEELAITSSPSLGSLSNNDGDGDGYENVT